MTIPPRPSYFSPMSAEEAAEVAAWDAKYGGMAGSSTSSTLQATTSPVAAQTMGTRGSTPWMEANGTTGASNPMAPAPALTGEFRGSGTTPSFRNGSTPMAPAGVFGPRSTIGSMSQGATTPSSSSSFPTNAVDNASQGNYTAGMKLSDYLNPAADWARNEGLKAVKSSYAGAGNFLSGPAMKGISNYASNSALNSAWQPAFNNYMQDKNFNYGVDSGDRAFAYGADRDLAQLGLQGTQGQASANSWLAGILAQLSQSAGQVQGAGTIGQNNALTTAIANALSNYQSGNVLNQLGLNGN